MAKETTATGPGWDIPNHIVITVMLLRIRDGLPPVKIVKYMAEKRGVTIGRERIYDALYQAQARGFLRINLPLEFTLADDLAAAYDISPVVSLYAAPAIQVVDVPAAEARREIPRQAGESTCLLIQEIASRKGKGARVHLALASGHVTHLVVAEVAKIIKANPKQFPPLTVHATAPGMHVSTPDSTPWGSVALLRDCGIDVEFVAFNSPPIVLADRYEEHKAMPGLRDAFARAHEVDLVITSMGSAGDDDGEVRRLFTRLLPLSKDDRGSARDAARGAGRTTSEIDRLLSELPARLERLRPAGDVMYQIYNADGAIGKDAGFHAAALYDIPDLVRFAAQPDKAVLLVCGPCVKHGRSKSEALAPLLKNPALRVWSHLVVDRRTAEECTDMALETMRAV